MLAHYTNSPFKVEVKNGFDAQEVLGKRAMGCAGTRGQFLESLTVGKKFASNWVLERAFSSNSCLVMEVLCQVSFLFGLLFFFFVKIYIIEGKEAYVGFSLHPSTYPLLSPSHVTPFIDLPGFIPGRSQQHLSSW